MGGVTIEPVQKHCKGESHRTKEPETDAESKSKTKRLNKISGNFKEGDCTCLEKVNAWT